MLEDIHPMKCPFCGHEELKVTDSRNALDANAIRRRRECLKCNRRFTTFETLELTIQVHKRDGRYENFVEQKSQTHSLIKNKQIPHVDQRKL